MTAFDGFQKFFNISGLQVSIVVLKIRIVSRACCCRLRDGKREITKIRGELIGSFAI